MRAEGQVMLIPGARSIYDLNIEYAHALAARRKMPKTAEEKQAWIEQVRKCAGIRPLAGLPESDFVLTGEYGVGELRFRRFIVEPEPGIRLRCALMNGGHEHAALFVHENGLDGWLDDARMLDLARGGATIMLAEVRGTGQSRQDGQTAFGEAIGLDWEDFFKAYCLGVSYVGMRAEDIMLFACHLANMVGRPVDLYSWGNAGVPALHAAAVAPELFASVHPAHCLESWTSVIEARVSRDQLMNAVHGALKTYDLPDLIRCRPANTNQS